LSDRKQTIQFLLDMLNGVVFGMASGYTKEQWVKFKYDFDARAETVGLYEKEDMA